MVVLLLALAAFAKDKTLQNDDGKQEGKKSSAGTGHVVSFERPRGKWWVKAVAVCGARYGGGYDASATEFTVTVCDGDGRPLGETKAKYDLFAPGRFEWVEIPLDEAVEVPASFTVVAAFDPTGTRGVFVAWSKAGKESHSAFGLPGAATRPFADGEWMIRAVLTNRKPKATPKKVAPKKEARPSYLEDFEFVARTVRDRYPALRKKHIDWDAACAEARPRFADCPDDATHVRNVARLLAVLGDSHTGITRSRPSVDLPAFDGLFGGGAWIATEGDLLLLRAWVPGHPLAGRVPPGSELVAVDGAPAGDVQRRVREQVTRWFGFSSLHFLDARLSFQFFPFGEMRTVEARFRRPDGREVEVRLERWGPGGKGLSRIAVTMPEGVAAEGRAVAAPLEGGTGYVRILGGMDDATQAELFAALDRVRECKGLILDCRGMGGGGDGPAWAMAGRFFRKRTPQGSAPALVPTGGWQFDGPVVLLQDERMISSAETFTWAMTETGRALSVGRPTGGATIIPTSFDAPSGILSFRLGVHDRATPIRGVQPEGVGTAPDVPVAYTPDALAGGADPILAMGRRALELLLQGRSRDQVVAELARR